MPSSIYYAVLLALVLGVGCGEKPLTKEESAKVIEAAIRKATGKLTGEITKADLDKVTELDLEENQLTDVKGLEKLTELEELFLGHNQLAEVPKELEILTQLKDLRLDYNQLTSVQGLEKLTQLKALFLYGNKLTSVQGLENLTQLTLLNLSNNQLTELPKGLEKLTQLRSLVLDNNPDLTKAQIAELKKRLNEAQVACTIYSNPTK